ncbi:MAG: TauD/TfdA family dioxygenase [Gammaproteobacteria bacterium]|nr:TauD/TfdA family dioxygenase [Gammaproteobacteria bacterium]
MAIAIRPSGVSLGAEVTNVRLGQLSPTEWAVIEDAFHEFGVLTFPKQFLKEDEQIQFARRFGELEHVSVPISNQRKDGSIVGEDAHRYWILRGNERWHHDSSFMPLAAKASSLTAVVVPSDGGQTEWADARAGYDALDSNIQEKLETLCARHSNYWSHEQLGQPTHTGEGYGFHTHGAPLRPLIKIHPVTNRKAVYSGRHAYGIEGFSPEESFKLLKELIEFIAQPPRVWGIDWEPGDFAIFDNRCIMHRVQPYDYSEARVMRHTRVAGDPLTEFAPTVQDERADDYQPGSLAHQTAIA